MNIQITINCDNAAFDGISGEKQEIIRILNNIACNLKEPYICNFSLYDLNGNKIGKFEVIEETEVKP